jgi:hypothetical protein
MRYGWLVSLGALALACGGSDKRDEALTKIADTKPNVTSIEIAEFEIGQNGIDRFTSCPPSGELGQGWIPPIPPWSPSAKTEAAPLPSADAEPRPSDSRSPTERAIHDTYPDFRSCYHRGLVRDPTQDGHAAIVLRVGSNGLVQAAESYGACDLSSEVIACMRAAAARLRFDPPPAGSDTITIPAVFTTRNGKKYLNPSPNDSYTAQAYIIVESARPGLHACELAARKFGRDIEATATFALELDAQGKIVSTNIDPWTGDQELLGCAAKALGQLTFPPPPAGRGSVLARFAFNPRAGTR